MTTKPIFLLDLDDTLNLFSQHFWMLHGDVHGIHIAPETVTSWDMSAYSPVGKAVYDLLQYPGFFAHVPPRPFAKEAVAALEECGEVYFVSDSPPGTPFAATGPFGTSNPADDKRKWLATHFPFIPSHRIIFCRAKWMIKGDVLLDDRPDTFLSFTEQGRGVVLFDMPYNQHIETKWRAHTLEEAVVMMQQRATEPQKHV